MKGRIVMKTAAIRQGRKSASERLLVTLMVLGLVVLGTVGCGGGDESAPAQINDEWDEMDWDDGAWTHRLDLDTVTSRFA